MCLQEGVVSIDVPVRSKACAARHFRSKRASLPAIVAPSVLSGEFVESFGSGFSRLARRGDES